MRNLTCAPFTTVPQACPRAAGRASRSRVCVVAANVNQKAASLVDQVQTLMRNGLLGAAAAAIVMGGSGALPSGVAPAAQAGLLNANPVTNAEALLRYALPIDNKPIREIQKSLEMISEDLRVPGSKSLGNVAKRVRTASAVIERQGAAIVKDFAPQSKADGEAALAKLKQGLSEFQALISADDKQEVPIKQQECLSYVGAMEQAMVKGFPFEVPKEYAGLPQLKGRATVDMKLTFATPRMDGVTGGDFTIVADGYNAPLSAGDFVDLCNRGFYDGMEIQRADGFVVQTGKPDGDAQGFVENGEVRRIPFEVMVEGDKAPVYEETLEDNGRFNEQPRLPFNAFGTVAMARGEFEANSASSQIFFLLKESELTPTGSNLLDGRYAVLGYITKGAELLKDLQVGDKIEYAKVVAGLDLLQPGK